MDQGERRDSPAPACVPGPQPQDEWLSPARRVVRAQGFCGRGSPLRGWALACLIGAARSVCTQQGRSVWEVAAAKSSSVSDAELEILGCRNALSPSPPGCSDAGLGAMVFPCAGNTLCREREDLVAVEGCTQRWVVFQGLGDGAMFPPQGKPCSFPSYPGQEEGHRCLCAGGGMELCVDPCQGCTITNPTLGALCWFSGWHVNSPLRRKNLPGEHHASLLPA